VKRILYFIVIIFYTTLFFGCPSPSAQAPASALKIVLGTTQSISSKVLSSRAGLSRDILESGGVTLPSNYVEFRFGINASTGSLYLGQFSDTQSTDTVKMNVYNTALGPGVGLDDADSEILQYGALVKGNPGGNTGIFMAKISTISSTTLATTLLSGTLNGTFDEGVLLLGCGGGWNMAGYAQDFGPQFIINGLPDNTNSSNVISGHFGYGIGINGGANVYNNAPTETGDLVFSNDGGTTSDLVYLGQFSVLPRRET
jgi:hypothetical protein